VNAIRDAFLVVDGPDCVYIKTQYIQGNQDYLSTLTNVIGAHRVVNTALEPVAAALSREAQIIETLRKVGDNEEVGCVMVTSMPMASVLGTDYARLGREASDVLNKDVLHVPGKSLSKDWVGGYEESLLALAKGMSLDGGAPKTNNVALVGMLHDRNEEDAAGNVREIRRLLRALGLDLVSVWLDGSAYADYRAVKDAGTILSLPYGRRAARHLSKRLGAELIELDLPFGLQATERFVRQVADHFGRVEAGQALMDRELRNIVPKLEWVIPFALQGKSFGYMGSAALLPGFAEIAALWGAEVRFAVVTNFASHKGVLDGLDHINPVLIEPRVNSLIAFGKEHVERGCIDCLVTDSTCIEMADARRHAVVGFGFPSYNVHALHDNPYLGFRGFLAFVDRVANAIRLFEALKVSGLRVGPTG
ncbi:MAG: nitrogenase component 1, partial [Myxococcota bacterium]